jgi:hypothetical protein
MKKLIVEEEEEGLAKLIGEKVTLFCVNYFYTGKLVGVSEDLAKLEDPGIVYETGKFDTEDWEDCQSLNVKSWYVKLSAVESFGVLK